MAKGKRTKRTIVTACKRQGASVDLKKENAALRRKPNEVDQQQTATADARTVRGSDKLALLRNNLLFRDLPAPVLDHLCSYMKTRKVAKGATIFSKGDPGTGLLGVLTGAVKVSIASADGKDIVLNVFPEGEIFGEIALLDGCPRAADATAMSDCELAVIERQDFTPFLSDNPDVSLKFVEILCARLRQTSEQVQEVYQQQAATADVLKVISRSAFDL